MTLQLGDLERPHIDDRQDRIVATGRDDTGIAGVYAENMRSKHHIVMNTPT